MLKHLSSITWLSPLFCEIRDRVFKIRARISQINHEFSSSALDSFQNRYCSMKIRIDIDLTGLPGVHIHSVIRLITLHEEVTNDFMS